MPDVANRFALNFDAYAACLAASNPIAATNKTIPANGGILHDDVAVCLNKNASKKNIAGIHGKTVSTSPTYFPNVPAISGYKFFDHPCHIAPNVRYIRVRAIPFPGPK